MARKEQSLRLQPLPGVGIGHSSGLLQFVVQFIYAVSIIQNKRLAS